MPILKSNICLHVREGQFCLGVRVLWHTWTVLHLRGAVQGLLLSTSLGSVLWVDSSGFGTALR